MRKVQCGRLETCTLHVAHTILRGGQPHHFGYFMQTTDGGYSSKAAMANQIITQLQLTV